MAKNREYNFFEMGAEFGATVAKCSEQSIVSLLAERARMINANFDIKAVAEYKRGAVSAIANANRIETENTNFNNKLDKTR